MTVSNQTGSVADGTDGLNINADGSQSITATNQIDQTSFTDSIASDGSSTTTTYTGPDGTGTATGIDQENADGTSQITAFDSTGNAYTVGFSGPGCSGTATSENLTTPTLYGSQTTIALPAISVVFPTIRVTPAGLTPQVFYQFLPLQVLSGSEIDEVLTTSNVLQVGQATGSDVSSDYGVGNYPAGTPGSIFVAIDTADLVKNDGAQASALFQNTPLQLTLTTPEGPLTAEVFANASIYAAATPSYVGILDFGNLHVGDHPTLNLTVSNTTAAGPLDDTLNVGAVSSLTPSPNLPSAATARTAWLQEAARTLPSPSLRRKQAST